MNYPMYNGYMPQYQTPMQNRQGPVTTQTPMPPTNPDDRIWVQSEAQAEAYLVSPSGFVRLWHISEPMFYEKGCDQAGRPTPMVAYRYEKVENRPSNNPNGMIVPNDKLNALETRIEALESILKEKDNADKSNEFISADK
jgi:hypothetical protein